MLIETRGKTNGHKHVLYDFSSCPQREVQGISHAAVKV